MPKVLLTESQRIEQRYTNLRTRIVERLAAVKNRERLSNEKLGKRIGVNRATMGRMLSGETVSLDTTEWLRLLDVAGLTLKERRRDAIQKEADEG